MFRPTDHEFGLKDSQEIQESHPTQKGRHPKTEPSESAANLAKGGNLAMNQESASVKVPLEALEISEFELTTS